MTKEGYCSRSDSIEPGWKELLCYLHID